METGRARGPARCFCLFGPTTLPGSTMADWFLRLSLALGPGYRASLYPAFTNGTDSPCVCSEANLRALGPDRERFFERYQALLNGEGGALADLGDLRAGWLFDEPLSGESGE